MVIELSLTTQGGTQRRRLALPLRIGRDLEADIPLRDERFSRTQCEILMEGGAVVLRHLGRGAPTLLGERALRRRGEGALWPSGIPLRLGGLTLRWAPAQARGEGDATQPCAPPTLPPDGEGALPRAQGTVAVVAGGALDVEGQERGKVAPRWMPTSDLTRWGGLSLALSVTLGSFLFVASAFFGAQGEALLSPGPLSEIHDAVVTEGCGGCHVQGAAVSEGCQTCHGAPGSGSDGPEVHRAGPHFASTEGPSCGACHAEHRGTLADIRPPSGGACLDCHTHAHMGDGERFAPHPLEPRAALPCAGCHLGHPAPGAEITLTDGPAPWPPAGGADPGHGPPGTQPLALALGLCLSLLPAGGIALWRRRQDPEVEDAPPPALALPKAQLPHINTHTCVGCKACVDACPFDVLEIVAGVARVAEPSACHGIALCEAACPNGSLTLIEGPEKVGIPPVTEGLESTRVPGIYIVGDLTGLPLIKNAINHGVMAAQSVAQRPRPPAAEVDVVIVGAGPAGLAAAVRAQELGLSHRIYERETLAHTIRTFPRQKLVMAQPFEIPLLGRFPMAECSKEALIERWEALIAQRKIAVREGEGVTAVRRQEGGVFEIETAKGRILAGSVILAIGIRGKPRRLGVPGEELEKVTYSLADAQRYQGVDVLVVGGGDSALEAALALSAQRGNRVTLSYRKGRISRAKARNREALERALNAGTITALWSSTVEEIGSDRVRLSVEGVQREIPNAYVFIFAGGEPPVDFLKEVGVV